MYHPVKTVRTGTQQGLDACVELGPPYEARAPPRLIDRRLGQTETTFIQNNSDIQANYDDIRCNSCKISVILWLYGALIVAGHVVAFIALFRTF